MNCVVHHDTSKFPKTHLQSLLSIFCENRLVGLSAKYQLEGYCVSKCHPDTIEELVIENPIRSSFADEFARGDRGEVGFQFTHMFDCYS
jgi:hypothetical protein